MKLKSFIKEEQLSEGFMDSFILAVSKKKMNKYTKQLLNDPEVKAAMKDYSVALDNFKDFMEKNKEKFGKYDKTGAFTK